MKTLFLAFAFLASTLAHAEDSIDGIWTIDGPRVCSNGNEIQDESFSKVVTGYKYEIKSEFELTLTITALGEDTKIQYFLSKLFNGPGAPWVGMPGTNPFPVAPIELVREGATLKVSFRDSKRTICDGGSVITRMKR